MNCKILTPVIMLSVSSFLFAQPMEEEKEMLALFWTVSGSPAQNMFGQGFGGAGSSTGRDLNKDGIADPSFFADDPNNSGSKMLIVQDGKNPGTIMWSASLAGVCRGQGNLGTGSIAPSIASREIPAIFLVAFSDIVPGKLRTVVLATKEAGRFTDPIVINPNTDTYWCGTGKTLLGIAEMTADVCCEVIASDPASKSITIYTKNDSTDTRPTWVIQE